MPYLSTFLAFFISIYHITGQQKIATVDYDSILQKHPQLDYIETLVDTLALEFQNILVTKQGKMENYYNEIMQCFNCYGHCHDGYNTKTYEDSIAVLQGELEELVTYGEIFLVDFKDDALLLLKEDIQRIIAPIARTNKITYCIDKKYLLYTAPNAIDITDQVIDAYPQHDYQTLEDELLRLYKGYIFTLKVRDFVLPDEFVIPYNYKH